MTMIVLWSDRNCMRSENLSICWTYEYLLMFTVIWDFSSVWQANHNFELKCCQKWCSHEKVRWFFSQSQIHILMFATFTFWFDWDVFNWCFPHSQYTKEILIFTFPFYLDWDFYQLIFFSICKYTNVLHTIFHFSLLVWVRLRSIDVFLNL